MAPQPEDDPQLADYLRRLGATEGQVRSAFASIDPARLALDLTLTRSFTLSTTDIADRLDLPLGRVAEMIHAMGLPVPDPHEPAFNDDDVELFRVADQIGSDLAHVLASALNRIADAAIASYVQSEPRFGESPRGLGVDGVTRARAEAEAGELALKFARSLGSIFVHLLREAVSWQRISQEDVAEQALARVAVGFVDLVGFTSMSHQMIAAELAKLVSSFESTAFAIATDRGGRVIKHIGDEVMFVALDAETGVRIARALIDTFTDQGIRPRGGLVHGELLALHGDYYGSVVNLAARLTDEAIPGELLVDAHTAEAAGGAEDLVFEPAGRRMVKGFGEPIATYSLVEREPP